jgi:hypothetical protein
MGEPRTSWVRDEQQASYVDTVFDLTLQPDPITVRLEDIDEPASLSIGQNRAEMALDQDTVDILAMFMDDGVAVPMPLVWKAKPSGRKVVVLDGNHRIAAALRKREEPDCQCLLVTGDSQLAQRLAVVVNTQHGRSTRSGEYVATAMRLLREQGVPIPQVARMFGVTESKVGLMTRRDQQQSRLRQLLPERHGPVKLHALDLLSSVEDAHVRILGELFLDAPKAQQEDIVARLRDAPSALRDAVAHEAVGELRELDRARRKVKATTTRPASQLQGALQRLVGVLDPTRAYFASSDQAKAIMRANLAVVMPRLQRLVVTVADQQEGAA